MKKRYQGLGVMAVGLSISDGIQAIGTSGTSGGCTVIVTLVMQDYVCVSPDDSKQIEYIGDQS